MIELLRKLALYFLTGGSAAIVDLGGFAILERAGVGLVYGAVLSFGLASVFNYVLTSLFVFRTKPSPRRYARFLFAAVVGAGVNVCVTIIAVHLVGLPPVLGKATGIAVAFLVNFVLNISVVFRAASLDDAESKVPGAAP